MEADRDHRVTVRSKRFVTDQISRYRVLLEGLLEGQDQLSDSDKNPLVQDLLSNFEFAVQENVLVNGLLWDEAPEETGEEFECSTLDDLLDEKIVQTTWKRSSYPKKILPYVVRSLKSERKLMNLFENAVKVQEVKRDPVQGTIMNDVSTAAPMMFSQASAVMKSLKTLKQMAEGLHQVLNMESSAETLNMHRDVFCGTRGKKSVPPCRREPAGGIQRAVSEHEYSTDYVP